MRPRTFKCLLQQNPSEVIFASIDDTDDKECSDDLVQFARSQIQSGPVSSVFETDVSPEEMRGHIFAIHGRFGKVPTEEREELLGDARAKFEEVHKHLVKERKKNWNSAHHLFQQLWYEFHDLGGPTRYQRKNRACHG